LAEVAYRAILENKIDLAQNLADAYWTPGTFEWKFWEYISQEIVVEAEQEWPDLPTRTVALETYSADKRASQRFVSELEAGA
jgi:hypothetical protein